MVDLSSADFANSSLWLEVAGASPDFGNASQWIALAGTPGAIYKYVGTPGSFDLNDQNYSASSRWVQIAAAGAAPQVAVTATESATIEATSFAAAVSLSIGGSNGVSVAGGGSTAVNLIDAATHAAISSSTLNSVGAVTVKAADTSVIEATVASIAASVAAGGSNGVGVAIGVSFALNRISDGTASGQGSVEADIVGSSITASGPVDVGAQAAETIDAVTEAAAVGLGGGGTTGVAVSGAGVGDINQSDVAIKATVSGGSIRAGGVTVEASDTSSIEAFAGAAALSGAVGGTAGVGVAVGVSIAENDIHDPVSASITGVTSITTPPGAGVEVTAFEDATIEAMTVAASASISGGGTAGVSVAAAGASALNFIDDATTAVIFNSSLTSGGGVSVVAMDNSTIDAIVGAVAVSAAVGGTAGVGVALGVAVGVNEITGGVVADIDDSAITATGAVDVEALGRELIRSLTAAGSAGIAGGGAAGVAVAGAGAVAVNDIAVAVTAYVDNGDAQSATGKTVQSGGLSVAAVNSSTIGSEVDAASLSAGFGGAAGVAVSVGVSVAVNTIADPVTAYVNGVGSLSTGGGALSVTATSSADITAIASSASVSLSVGGAAGVSVAGGGAVAVNTITVDTEASIQGSALTNAGDVTVKATEAGLISAAILAVSAAVAGGGAAGVGVAIGLSVADNAIKSTASGGVKAYIKSTSISASGAVTVSALSEEEIDAIVAAGAAAFTAGGAAGVGVSFAGAFGFNSVSVATDAYIDGGGTHTFSAGGFSVSAANSARIAAVVGAASVALSFAGAAGVSVTVGLSVARNTITDSEAAYVTGAKTLDAGTGAVSVEARESAVIDAAAFAASVAVGGGIAGVAVAGAATTAENLIGASVDAHVVNSTIGSAGDVTVSATDTSHIYATVGAVSAAIGGGLVGVGVAIGASSAHNAIGDGAAGPGVVTAYLSGAGVRATGTLLIEASSTETIDAEIASMAAAVAGGFVGVAASGAAGVALNAIKVNTTSYIYGDAAPGASITGVKAGGVSVTGDGTSTITANVVAAALSASVGFVGASISLGVSSASNQIQNVVDVHVANAGVTATSGSVALSAKDKSTITANSEAAAVAFSGGVVAFSAAGGGATATNVILTSVEAYFQGGDVTASGDVRATASSSPTIAANVFAASGAAAIGLGGGALSFGASFATNDIGYTGLGALHANLVLAYATGSTITAGGAFDLTATDHARITANVAGVSAAVTAAIGGSASGAGSVAVNAIGVDTWAFAGVDPYAPAVPGNASTNIDAGSIAIEASDTSTITATVVAGSIAATLIGNSFSVATASATNTINNETRAWISGAGTGGPAIVRSAGQTGVEATENAGISAQATAAALSISGWAGGAISGGGANASDDITTDTEAFVSSSVLTVGALSVGAQDTSTASADTFGAAASFGLISLAAAGSNATVNVTDAVYAYIDQSTVAAKGDVSVTATGQPAGSGTANGMSAGTLAISGSVSTVTVNPTVRATVDGTIATGATPTYAVGSIPTFGEGGDPNFIVGKPGVGVETLVAGDVVQDGTTLYVYANTTAAKILDLSTDAALLADLSDFTRIDYVVKAGAGARTLNHGDTIADGTTLYTYTGASGPTIELDDDTALLALGVKVAAPRFVIGTAGLGNATLTAGDIVQDGSTLYAYKNTTDKTFDLSTDAALLADLSDFMTAYVVQPGAGSKTLTSGAVIVDGTGSSRVVYQYTGPATTIELNDDTALLALRQQPLLSGANLTLGGTATPPVTLPNFAIGTPGLGVATLTAGNVVRDGDGTLYEYDNGTTNKAFDLSTDAALKADLADFTKIAYVVGAGAGSHTLNQGDTIADGRVLYTYSAASPTATSIDLTDDAELLALGSAISGQNLALGASGSPTTLKAGDVVQDGSTRYVYTGPGATIDLSNDVALTSDLADFASVGYGDLSIAANANLRTPATFSYTGATTDKGVTTFTGTGMPELLTGREFIVSGDANSTYNGSYIVESSTSTALTARLLNGAATGASTGGAVTAPYASAQARATGSAGGLVALVGSGATARDNAVVTAGVFNWSDFGAAGVKTPGDDIASSTTLTLAGGLSVAANSNTWQEASADNGGSYGLIAGGAAQSFANAHNVTQATVGQGATITAGSVKIGAAGNDADFAETTAGSGGLVSGVALAPTTSDIATTQATLARGASITALQEPMPGQSGSGAVSVSSGHTATVGTSATASSYGVLAGAGAIATNTVNSTVDTVLAGTVTANAIAGGATNTFNMPAADPAGAATNVITGDTGGLASAAGAWSTTTIVFSTKVDVLSGAALDVVAGSGAAGALSLAAFNAFHGGQTVSLKTGGALAGAAAEAIVTTRAQDGGNDLAEVNVAGGATLQNAAGVISLTADGTSNMTSQVNTDTYGVVTAAYAESDIYITPDNEIVVGTANSSSKAVIRAGQADVDLFAGEGADLAYDTYSVTAYTDAYAGALIPLGSVNANAYLTQTNSVTVYSGSLVQTGGSAWLEANNNVQAEVFAKAKSASWASDVSDALLSLTGGDPANEFAGTGSSTASGRILIDGEIQTGLSRDVVATFTSTPSSDLTALSARLTMEDAKFTGAIAAAPAGSDFNSILTVSSVASGGIGLGWTLYINGVDSGLTVASQLTGAPGGAGTYGISGGAVTLGSQTITAGTPIGYSFYAQAQNPPANPLLESALTFLGDAETAGADATTIAYDKGVVSALQRAFNVQSAPGLDARDRLPEHGEAVQHRQRRPDAGAGPREPGARHGASIPGPVRQQRPAVTQGGDAAGGSRRQPGRNGLRSLAEHDLPDRRRADQRAGRPDLPIRRIFLGPRQARRADRHQRRHREQHRRHAPDRGDRHPAERRRRARAGRAGDVGQCGAALARLHLPRDHAAGRRDVPGRDDHDQQRLSAAEQRPAGGRRDAAGHHRQRSDRRALRRPDRELQSQLHRRPDRAARRQDAAHHRHVRRQHPGLPRPDRRRPVVQPAVDAGGGRAEDRRRSGHEFREQKRRRPAVDLGADDRDHGRLRGHQRQHPGRLRHPDADPERRQLLESRSADRQDQRRRPEDAATAHVELRGQPEQGVRGVLRSVDQRDRGRARRGWRRLGHDQGRHREHGLCDDQRARLLRRRQHHQQHPLQSRRRRRERVAGGRRHRRHHRPQPEKLVRRRRRDDLPHAGGRDGQDARPVRRAGNRRRPPNQEECDDRRKAGVPR